MKTRTENRTAILVENPPSFAPRASDMLPAETTAKAHKPIPKLAGPRRLCRLADMGRDFADWYPAALSEACAVCELEAWKLRRFVDVLAITSPRVSVRRNVRTALQYLQSGSVFPNTPSMISASLRGYESSGRLSARAPKISAFRSAILGDRQAIVIDVWIARALRIDQRILQRRAVRQACEKRIRQASRRFGLQARDFQACLWAGLIRELSSKRPQYLPILAEYANWQAYEKQYPQTGYIERLAD